MQDGSTFDTRTLSNKKKHQQYNNNLDKKVAAVTLNLTGSAKKQKTGNSNCLLYPYGMGTTTRHTVPKWHLVPDLDPNLFCSPVAFTTNPTGAAISAASK
jgi:hypothetical protein